MGGRSLESHRVGVISDTHGYFDSRIPELFDSVDLILHAGDVGGREILRKLSGTAPVVAVQGNVDPGTDCCDLPEAAWVSIGKVDIYMTHIFTLPPPDFTPASRGPHCYLRAQSPAAPVRMRWYTVFQPGERWKKAVCESSLGRHDDDCRRGRDRDLPVSGVTDKQTCSPNQWVDSTPSA